MVSHASDVQALVIRAQEQDGQAFGQLYELYSRKVYSYFYYRLRGEPRDAEDLTAEVFIKAFEKIGGYQFRGAPFSAWLFRIAHNHLIDHVRSRPAIPTVPLDLAPEVATMATPEELERRLTADQLKRALTRLTDDQQQVIVLRFIEGMSTAQAARTIGKSEDAVKKLQARGLIALKRVLDAER